MWTRERISVCAYFAILGIVCSAWVSSLDELKLMLQLEEDQMGWLLLCGPIGNMISFTFASTFLARVGARKGAVLASFAYVLSAVAITACFLLKAPVLYWCVVIAFFGGSGNVVNIAINALAGHVEKSLGKQIMSSFHGIFSLLMFIGSLLAVFGSATALPAGPRLAVSTGVAVCLHLAFLWTLPREESDPAVVAAGEDRRWRRPDRMLFAVGLAALVAMGCEGSICDWVCIFFRESLGAAEGRAKWGLCAVTGMMAFGRLVGDRLVNRLTARRVLHGDCLLVAAGLALALSTPYLSFSQPVTHQVATIGYAIAGFGISGLIPILYSKANRTTSMSKASAITFVGSMGFLGYFLAPPLIGHIAKWTGSLSLALGLFAGLILFCLLLDPDRE